MTGRELREQLEYYKNLATKREERLAIVEGQLRDLKEILEITEGNLAAAESIIDTLTWPQEINT